MAALDLMAILRNAGVNLDAPAPSTSGSGDQTAIQSTDTGQRQQPQNAASSEALGSDTAPVGETAEAANISDQLMSLVGMLSTGAINGS